VTPSPYDYCPFCGTGLAVRHVEGRERAYCPACDRPIYHNPKPCAGVVVVDRAGRRPASSRAQPDDSEASSIPRETGNTGDEDTVLLIERTNPPAAGAWSLPAGYLEANEPAREAAARELREETGLDVAPTAPTLLETTLSPHDEWHVLVVIYAVAREHTTGEPHAGSDAARARFWRLPELQRTGERIEPGYRAIFERAIETVGDGPDG